MTAQVTIEVFLADELQEGDEYAIEDAIADALRKLGYTVESVKAS